MESLEAFWELPTQGWKAQLNMRFSMPPHNSAAVRVAAVRAIFARNRARVQAGAGIVGCLFPLHSSNLLPPVS